MNTITENTLTEAFAAQVKSTPDSVAVRDENRSLTFHELDQMANSIIAHFPQSPERVGVVMDHGIEMIAALWAVLKTDAAYVPAEPSFPPDRITYMMEQSDVDFVISQPHYETLLGASEHVFIEPGFAIDEKAPEVNEPVSPDDMAYVLYTSGTTGYPKGVVVEHRNVCNYVRAFHHEFGPDETDVMLQNSVCSFDIFVEEVFTVMLAGGSLAIPNSYTHAHFPSLMNFVDAYGITIMSGFPYLFWDVNKFEYLPKSLRLLISGGDVLKASYASYLVDKIPLYNTYGPTETTVCATYFKCNGYEPLEDGTYPIGKPVQGAEVTLRDEKGLAVAQGEVGEIWISGKGVSRGYLDTALSEGSFCDDEEGRRWYRSGDLGRLLPDGNLAFLKRCDAQVMIMGKRVEPQVVENVLERNRDIAHAAVTTALDETGLAYLIAYIVPATKGLSDSRLRSYLAQHVPAYMIPEYFVTVNEMPLTLNGKVDYCALPVVLKGSSL